MPHGYMETEKNAGVNPINQSEARPPAPGGSGGQVNPAFGIGDIVVDSRATNLIGVIHSVHSDSLGGLHYKVKLIDNKVMDYYHHQLHMFPGGKRVRINTAKVLGIAGSIGTLIKTNAYYICHKDHFYNVDECIITFSILNTDGAWVDHDYDAGQYVKVVSSPPKVQVLWRGCMDSVCGKVGVVRGKVISGQSGFGTPTMIMYEVLFDGSAPVRFNLLPEWLSRPTEMEIQKMHDNILSVAVSSAEYAPRIFKKGDFVKVISFPDNKFPSSEAFCWVEGMNKLCGEIGTIIEVGGNSSGVWYRVSIPSGKFNYYFRPEWLTPATEAEYRMVQKERDKAKAAQIPKVEFKAGDYVEIVAKPPLPPDGHGWMPAMNEFCGKMGTVDGVAIGNYLHLDYSVTPFGKSKIDPFYFKKEWLIPRTEQEFAEWKKKQPLHKKGDRVRVIWMPPIHKELFPMWTDPMDHFCGMVATIASVNKRGCYTLAEVNGKGYDFSFNEEWLLPISDEEYAACTKKYKVGDRVQIIPKPPALMEGWLAKMIQQRPVSGWLPGMDKVCGKFGTVISTIIPSGCTVSIPGEDHSFQYEPEWLMPCTEERYTEGLKAHYRARFWLFRIVSCPEEFRNIIEHSQKKFKEEGEKMPTPEPKFKLHQIVKIILRPPSDRKVGPTWADDMDELCGRISRITSVTSKVKETWFHVDGYDFLAEWLLPVKATWDDVHKKWVELKDEPYSTVPAVWNGEKWVSKNEPKEEAMFTKKQKAIAIMTVLALAIVSASVLTDMNAEVPKVKHAPAFYINALEEGGRVEQIAMPKETIWHKSRQCRILEVREPLTADEVKECTSFTGWGHKIMFDVAIVQYVDGNKEIGTIYLVKK